MKHGNLQRVSKMELELGLKITKTRDDLLSSSEIWFTKDRTGPIFLSRETESMFILTAYLKGYRKENIDIDINEDGTQIAISGNRPVQEMTIMGWVMTYQREEALKGFRRVFRIPDGVNLDRIKARFEDEESVLTVVMPKRVKGIFGDSIEEVQDMEPVAGTSESIQTIDDNVPAGDIGGEMPGEELDDNAQAAEETGNAVEHETKIKETKPAQGRLGKQPATEHMEETGQASKENLDKTAESKARMPWEVLGKEESRRKVYEEINEPDETRMTQIKQVVDVPGENQEIEETEAPPSIPPIKGTRDKEKKMQEEIDRPTSAITSEIIENRTKDIHLPEDQTRNKKSIDGRLDDKSHAVENNIDSVEHEGGKRKAKSSQGGLDGEPIVEHREETSRAREDNACKREESKATMPSEVPETERIRKIRKDMEELEETSMAQTSQVGDVPEEIREYKELESAQTLPPFQETKENDKQLRGENNRPSSEEPPKLEERKIKDHLPEKQTRKQDATDGRLDDKGQAVEKNINTVEHERGERKGKPSQGRLDGEPTVEHIEETRAREENACKIEESKATMPNEVQEIERIRKIREDIQEPEETSMAQTSQVVDVPEDIREYKEVESPPTVPSFQETKEKEEQMLGENDRPSLEALQKIEERKIKNIHLPEDQSRLKDAMAGRLDNKSQGVEKNIDTMEREREKRQANPTQARLDGEQTRKQDAMDGRLDNKGQPVEKNIDTVEYEREKRKVKPYWGTHDGEPTIEHMEEISRVREEDAGKIENSKATMPNEVLETERIRKLHEKIEEPKETGIEQASQVVDAPKEVKSPLIIPHSHETKKEMPLREVNDGTSLGAPPEFSEKKIKDIHRPEDKTKLKDTLDVRLDYKGQVVEKNIDTIEHEREKGKIKPPWGRHDGEPTIEHMEENSRVREENAGKTKESKLKMPSEVTEIERIRKLHEKIEEPEETSIEKASQVMDVPKEIREYEEVKYPPTIPHYQETKEKEKSLQEENDRSCLRTPPEIEERKIKDIHLPQDQTRKKDTMDLRPADKVQAVDKNIDTVEHEREKRKGKPSRGRLDGEPTIEYIEETSWARDQNAGKTEELKATMPNQVPESEGMTKLHEETEESEMTNMAQTSRVVDVPKEIQEYEGVEFPPSIPPFQDTTEKDQWLRGGNDRRSLAAPPEVEERKVKDIHLPQDQTREQDAMNESLHDKGQILKENIETMERETEKRKFKPALVRLDRESAIEHIEESNHATERNVDKTAESKVATPHEVPEKDVRRKLHEAVEEPKKTTIAQISHTVDIPGAVREFGEAENPPTIPPLEETRGEENHLESGVDSRSSVTPPAVEEMKTKDVPQPTDQIRKQGSSEIEGPATTAFQEIQKPEGDALPEETEKLYSTTPTLEEKTNEDHGTILTFPETKELEEVEQKISTDDPGATLQENEKRNIEDARQLEDLKRKQDNSEAEAHAIATTIKEFQKPSEIQQERKIDRPSTTRVPTTEELKTQGIHQLKGEDERHDISTVEAPASTPKYKKDKEPKEVQQQREGYTDGPDKQMYLENEETETRDIHGHKDMTKKEDTPDVQASPAVPAPQETKQLKEVQQQRKTDKTDKITPPEFEKMDGDSYQLGDKRKKNDPVFASTVQRTRKLEEVQQQREIDKPGLKEGIPQSKAPLNILNYQVKEVQEQRQIGKSDEKSLPEVDKKTDEDSYQVEDQRMIKDKLKEETSDFTQTFTSTVSENTDTLERETEKRKAKPALVMLDQEPEIEHMEESSQATEKNGDKTAESKAATPNEVPERDIIRESHQEVEEPKKTPIAQISHIVDMPGAVREFEDVKNPPTIPPLEETRGEENHLESEVDSRSSVTPPAVEEMKNKDVLQPTDQIRKQGSSEIEGPATTAFQEIQKPEGDALPEETEKLNSTTPTLEEKTNEDHGTILTFPETKELEEVEQQISTDDPGATLHENEKRNIEDARQLEDLKRKQDNSEAEAHAIVTTIKEFQEPSEIQQEREIDRPSTTTLPTTEELKTQGIHQLKGEDERHDISTVEAPASTPKYKKDKEPKEVQQQREGYTDGPDKQMYLENEETKTRDIHQHKDITKKEDTPDVRASPAVPAPQETKQLKEVQQQRKTDKTDKITPPEFEKMDEDSYQLGDKRKEKDPVFASTVQKTRKLEEVQQQREIDKPGLKEGIPQLKAPLNILNYQVKEVQEQRQIGKSDEKSLPEVDKKTDEDSYQVEDQRKIKDKLKEETSDFTQTFTSTVSENTDTLERETEKRKAKPALVMLDQEPEIEHMDESSQATEKNGDKTAESKAATPNEVPERDIRRESHQEVEEPKKTPIAQISHIVDMPGAVREFEDVKNPPTIPPLEENRGEETHLQREVDGRSSVTPPAVEEVKNKDLLQPKDQIREQDSSEIKGPATTAFLEIQKSQGVALPKETDKSIPTIPTLEEKTAEDHATISTFPKTKELEEVEPQISTDDPGATLQEIEKRNIEDAGQLEDLTKKQDNSKAKAHAIVPTINEFQEPSEVQEHREINRPSTMTLPTTEELKTQGIHQLKSGDERHDISTVEAPTSIPKYKKDKEPKEVQQQREGYANRPGQQMYLENEEAETRDIHEPKGMTRKEDISHVEAPPIVPAPQETKELKEVQQQRKIDETDKITSPEFEKKMDEDSHQLEDKRNKKDKLEKEDPAFMSSVQKTKKLEKVQQQKEIDRPGIPQVKAPHNILEYQEVKEVQQIGKSDKKSLPDVDKKTDEDNYQLGKIKDESKVESSDFMPTFRETQNIEEVKPQSEIEGPARKGEDHITIPASQETKKLKVVPQQREISRPGKTPEAEKTTDEDGQQYEGGRKKTAETAVEASSSVQTFQETKKFEELKLQRETDRPVLEKDTPKLEAPHIRPASHETKELKVVQQHREFDRSNNTMPPEFGKIMDDDSHRLEDERKKQTNSEVQDSSFMPTFQETQELEEVRPQKEIDVPCRVKLTSLEELKPEVIHQLKDARRKKEIPELEASAVIPAFQQTQEHLKYPRTEVDKPGPVTPPKFEQMKTEHIDKFEDYARKQDDSDTKTTPIIATFQETQEQKEVLQKETDISSEKTPPNVEEIKSQDFHQPGYQKLKQGEIDRSSPVTPIDEVERKDIHQPTNQIEKEEKLEPEILTTMATFPKEVNKVQQKIGGDKTSPIMPPKFEKRGSEEIYQPEGPRKQVNANIEVPATPNASNEIWELDKDQWEKQMNESAPIKLPRILGKDVHQQKDRSRTQEDPKIEARATIPTFQEAREPKEDQSNTETTRTSPTMPPEIKEMKTKGMHQADPQSRKLENLEMETPPQLWDIKDQGGNGKPGPTTPQSMERMKAEDTYLSRARTRKQDNLQIDNATPEGCQGNDDFRENSKPDQKLELPSIEKPRVEESQHSDRSIQQRIQEDKHKIPVQEVIQEKEHSTDGQEQVKLEPKQKAKDIECRPGQDDREVTQETVPRNESWEDTDEESICADESQGTYEESIHTDETQDTDEDSFCTDESSEETDEDSICVERDFEEESICVEWEVDECEFIDVEEEGTPEKPGLCSSITVATSVLLVPIIVIVARHIRDRKR